MYIFLTLRSKTTTSGVVLAFVFEIVIHFFHTLPYVHEGILTECVYSKIQFERMNKENSTLHSPFTEQVKTKKIIPTRKKNVKLVYTETKSLAKLFTDQKFSGRYKYK